MASIAAGSFIEPRISHQTTSLTVIEFVSRHGGDSRIYELMIYQFPNSDPDLVWSSKQYLDSDRVANVKTVNLPKKMTAALHRAAVLKGYAHYGERV